MEPTAVDPIAMLFQQVRKTMEVEKAEKPSRVMQAKITLQNLEKRYEGAKAKKTRAEQILADIPTKKKEKMVELQKIENAEKANFEVLKSEKLKQVTIEEEKALKAFQAKEKEMVAAFKALEKRRADEIAELANRKQKLMKQLEAEEKKALAETVALKKETLTKFQIRHEKASRARKLAKQTVKDVQKTLKSLDEGLKAPLGIFSKMFGC